MGLSLDVDESDGAGETGEIAVRSRMSRAQRRSQLTDVGRSLFAIRGLDGTTIEEIAVAAGVSKPVIYEHFGSKEGLYREVVEQESKILLQTITGSLSEEAAPRILVERAALALLSYIEDRTDGFRILIRDGPAQAEGAFSTLFSLIVARVEHIFTDEFARRGFSPDDGAMYAQMLVGMVAMTGQWWLDVRKPSKEAVAAHVVNLAWHGLTGLRTAPELHDHH
ncbi:TetR/AcrR family transcriptional regulator [Arthrobacter russicus]|jgi:AcrR family transcriptional regulator|uniref:AcrR family transcriptional regulator n=2 Tax=Arthrobacter russicus TaxID=172040 RepID=A0ABU1J9I3_9MICC|nr:AcrR family transcriptional regulator [Arthrobacter russicus]